MATPRGLRTATPAGPHRQPTRSPSRATDRSHRLRRRLTALSALLAVSAVMFSVTGASPALAADGPTRVRSSFFGIHDGSMQAYGRVWFGSVRLWDAGVAWRQVETSPGVYDWTRLDSLVSAAQAHHTQVTLVLAMTPSFYGPAGNQPPTDLGSYAAYVRAVMSRYRDFHGSRGISSYQVWNEGNVPTFWSASPAELAKLTQVVDQVRDQVDPDATVLAPSFAVRLPGQRRWLGHYEAQHVGGRAVWRYFDANALSLYPKASYDGRTGGPEDAMALLHRSRRVIHHAGVPTTKPVWATEINYGLKSGPPGSLSADPLTDRRQVANVLRTYLLGAARGLARVYWYRYDWGQLPDSEGGGTLGNTLLVTPGQWDQVTPAGTALATARRWLDGRLVDAGAHHPCAHNRHGTYRCVIRNPTGTRTIYWNPHHRATVQVRGPVTVQNQRGLTTRLPTRTATVKIGYQPISIIRR